MVQRKLKRTLNRRSFLKTLGSSLCVPYLTACQASKPSAPSYNGSIRGASSAVGHLLREKFEHVNAEEIHTQVVIVGGGVSGLSAAWWFKRHSFDRFLLFDLEHDVGGNSLSGKNNVSAYPWGAHYVPVPNREHGSIHELFKELGIIKGYSPAGKPIYEELYLCAAPEERLFMHGRWQEGIVPMVGVSAAEKDQYRRFFDLMEQYRQARGSDGRRAFSIPIANSSQDPKYLALDSISTKQYLERENFTSPHLHWYLDYCCRDDYGIGFESASAWAGIHYFASRDGWAENAEREELLTWPAGNGWITDKLRLRVAENLRVNTLIREIEGKNNKFTLHGFDTLERRPLRVHCEKLLLAVPRFVSGYMLGSAHHPAPARYSPWMVANLTVPVREETSSVGLSWDNVFFDSRSLGYVVANHQDPRAMKESLVLTYYQPLYEGDSSAARKLALARTYQEWCSGVIADLEKAHPSISRHIETLDIWLWGHAMVEPTPRYIWDTARTSMPRFKDGVYFAHSDMSGISIFEEAHYQGIESARALLSSIGIQS